MRGVGAILVPGTHKCQAMIFSPLRRQKVAIEVSRSFAQKNSSIVLDTRIREEHDHVEVSSFEARLPLRSPNAVSLKAKHRIER